MPNEPADDPGRAVRPAPGDPTHPGTPAQDSAPTPRDAAGESTEPGEAAATADSGAAGPDPAPTPAAAPTPGSAERGTGATPGFDATVPDAAGDDGAVSDAAGDGTAGPGDGAAAGEHYFTADPSAPATRSTVRFAVGTREVRLTAAGGVFSASRLDPGTAVLLRKAPLPRRAGTLLDLGCGYGPIAAALAVSAPAATVYAVDVNARALDLVRENAAALGAADRIVPATPDAVPADVVFDEIWSNPPIRIGKPALHGLLTTWLPRLAPGGVAWLVVARNLGADSLAGWLTTQGYAVDRHASQKGYRVLSVAAAG
ncbi:hypothetical protein GCM10022220_06900 [Actinocatenispora rupis]|uniref:Methyltransferase small domain-containing protein n=1 Tax=Actinocatenispora rupis TaxID=519421 RepID=A0A8J3NCC7_9ACTN|nr:hypothetical protein Aru02nite_25060 [Actinocatenispora rupis]